MVHRYQPEQPDATDIRDTSHGRAILAAVGFVCLLGACLFIHEERKKEKAATDPAGSSDLTPAGETRFSLLREERVAQDITVRLYGDWESSTCWAVLAQGRSTVLLGQVPCQEDASLLHPGAASR